MAIVFNGTLIKGRLVRGDQFPIRRTVRLGTGAIVSKAWLTVKANKTDADPGVFQKEITTIASASGQIEKDGSDGRGVAVLRFDLSSTDTLALTADQYYYYDVKLLFASGAIETIEQGTFSPAERITQDTT